MSPLKFWTIGLSEWAAWTTQDGQWAPAEARIAKTHLGWQVSIVHRADVLVSLHLQHQQFTFEDAERHANALMAGELPIGAAPQVDADIVQARLRQRLAAPARCQFVHAFPVAAGDDAVCQCGRVTKGWLRQQKVAS